MDPYDAGLAFSGGAVAATLLGGGAPTQEMEQIYYLGVLDPQEQLPPTVYRLTVHGQASFLSRMDFASGWVPAQFIDGLNSHVGFKPGTNEVTITQGDTKASESIQPGRHLVLFGPEGFREAPKDHRLVLVMGADPSKFFQAIDESLGVLAQSQCEQLSSEAAQDILATLLELKKERDGLSELKVDLAKDAAKASPQATETSETPEPEAASSAATTPAPEDGGAPLSYKKESSTSETVWKSQEVGK